MHESAAECEKGLVAFYKLAKAELAATLPTKGIDYNSTSLRALNVSPATTRAKRKSSAAEITHFRLELRRSANSGLGRNDRGE